MLKRAQFCALFLLLAACSKQEGSRWYCDTVCGSDTHSVLILSGSNSFKDLEIELQRTNDDKRIYLNGYGIPFTRNRNDKVDVMIQLDGQESLVEATLLQGGQSLRLPADAETELLNAIAERKPIYISIGRYSADVHYENFDKHFKKFTND
ncbi:MAG: hypothetical protein ACK5MA_02910 [Parachlamydiaceae bacterium]